MTVVLLALALSNTAIGSTDASSYRLEDQSNALAEPYAEPRSRTREWKPGLDGWKLERTDCPAFFSQGIDGFGALSVGPRCLDEAVPYSRSSTIPR